LPCLKVILRAKGSRFYTGKKGQFWSRTWTSSQIYDVSRRRCWLAASPTSPDHSEQCVAHFNP
jgi:hypothetical protein